MVSKALADASSSLPIEVGSGLEPEDQARELLEDYLDHLCSPLVGIVPYRERDRLRQEAGFNIEGRMQMYVLDGYASVEAMNLAIEKYGRSDQLGDLFLEEWVRYQPKGWLARHIGLPNAYAGFFFGQATLWGLVLVQIRVFAPNPEPFTFGLSLAQIRHIVPEPLPLPDQNPVFMAFFAYLLVAPFAAGWLTGRFAPIGASRAVYHVMVLLIIVAFAVGSLMLPAREGILLGFAELLIWLPVGMATAHYSSVVARRQRLRYRGDSVE
jgi:hypothetical protein